MLPIFSWTTDNTNKDILSLRDYDILSSRYTLLNLEIIKDYFDNEGNLNEVSLITLPTLQKVFIHLDNYKYNICSLITSYFNHLISLVHIFSSKQFKIHGTWDYENEIIIYTYNIIKNPFRENLE